MAYYFLFVLLAATGLALPTQPVSDNRNQAVGNHDVLDTRFNDNQFETSKHEGKRDEPENQREQVASFCWEHVDSSDYMRCKAALENTQDPVNFNDFFANNIFQIE